MLSDATNNYDRNSIFTKRALKISLSDPMIWSDGLTERVGVEKDFQLTSFMTLFILSREKFNSADLQILSEFSWEIFLPFSQEWRSKITEWIIKIFGCDKIRFVRKVTSASPWPSTDFYFLVAFSLEIDEMTSRPFGQPLALRVGSDEDDRPFDDSLSRGARRKK